MDLKARTPRQNARSASVSLAVVNHVRQQIIPRTINVAGIAFSHTTHKVEFAILGALAGAMTAFAIPFPPQRPTSNAETVLGIVG